MACGSWFPTRIKPTPLQRSAESSPLDHQGSPCHSVLNSPFSPASLVALVVKNPPANARDTKRYGFNFWVGKIPWRRNGNLLQYSRLENSTDGGAWWSWGRKGSDTIEHTTWVTFTRLLPPSKSKTELGGKKPHLTDGKTEAKKKKQKGNKGKPEASSSVTVSGWRVGW